MLNVFALKLMLLQVLPYIWYTCTHPEIGYLTARYGDVREPTRVYDVGIHLPKWHTYTSVIENRTQKYAMVDIPLPLQLCEIARILAPNAACDTPHTVSVDTIKTNFDHRLISGIFSQYKYDLCSQDDFIDLVVSNNYDEVYAAQSFPGSLVNVTEPITLQDVCPTCNSEPQWGTFMALGVRDTVIAYTAHYGTKILFSQARAWWRTVRAAQGASSGIPLTNLGPAAPEIFFSPISTPVSGSASSLAENFGHAGAVAYSSTTGVVVQGAARGTATVNALSFSQGLRSASLPNLLDATGTVASQISSGALRTVGAVGPAGELGGAAASRAGMTWLSRIAKIIRYTPKLRRKRGSDTIPCSGLGTKCGSGARGKNSLIPSNAPHESKTSGAEDSASVTLTEPKTTASTTKATHSSTPKGKTSTTPKTPSSTSPPQILEGTVSGGVTFPCRGKSRRTRGVWSVVTRALARVPDWVWPTAFSAVSWIGHGVDQLKVSEFKVPYMFSVLSLTKIERFYSASLAIMLDQCMRNKTMHNIVHHSYSYKANTIFMSGRQFQDSDILINMDDGRVGPVIHLCSPMFKTPIQGLSMNTLLLAFSIMFDTSVSHGNIIYYNGLTKMLDGERAVYINDIVPRFTSLVGIEEVSDYEPIERRKRQTSVVLPEYGNVVFNKNTSYTDSIYSLVNLPRARYEFDLILSSAYNTSTSYVRSLRYTLQRSNADYERRVTPYRLRLLPGVFIVDILRSVDRFSFAMPRLSILAELLDGFRTAQHFDRIRRLAASSQVSLQFLGLRELLYLFYVDLVPGDFVEAKTLVDGAVTPVVFSNVLNILYKDKMSRVPILIITRSEADALAIEELFVVHVRNTFDIRTWAKYSPILITTMTSLIPSAAFSLCVSNRTNVLRSDVRSAFTSSYTITDVLFTQECDIASEYITYTTSVSEIVASPYLPASLASMLSVASLPSTDFVESSDSDLYDPVLTDLLAVSARTDPHHVDLLVGQPTLTHQVYYLNVTGEVHDYSNAKFVTNCVLAALFVAVLLLVICLGFCLRRKTKAPLAPRRDHLLSDTVV